MKFLKIVGPDALINSFTVNVKGNTDVTVVNDLQSLIFNELNGIFNSLFFTRII